MLRDLGMLILRAVTGVLLMGHGSQKLFGLFGGGGIRGTSGFMEAAGIRPGGLWAFMAGATEFGGGLLTALGFLHPLGSIIMMAPMAMALGTAHWGKPIWASQGGGELPLTNMAVATAVAFAGPGRFSLDRALGIRVPGWAVVLAALATGFGIAERLYTVHSRPATPQQPVGSAEQPAIAADSPR